MSLRTLTIALSAAAVIALPSASVWASSHREAPFITEMPKVDGTDFYLFMGYEPGREEYVTLIANYLPLQAAYGGPNYFSLDPDALYEIHVDNDGDAKEDITFQFRFKNQLQNTSLSVGGKQVAIPLINSGAIGAGNTAALNVLETYEVSVVRGNRRSGQRQMLSNVATGAKSFAKPVDNIGNKSIPDYAAYAADHVYNVNIPGCGKPGRMFVGQRQESFVVNLGEIFDLINTNPLGPVDGEPNTIDEENITSLILEVHKSCLAATADPVIGGWTTASLRQGRLLGTAPGSAGPAKEGGAWVQVSRLGMPLVNELVIGLKDKDKFNAAKPQHDAQFADYVTNPTLPALIELLFPSAPAPTKFPRQDLVTAFLTGVPGLNQPAHVSAAEMLRLNTSIAPAAKGTQNNLGVLGGDNAGFPNGRRPGDDVVDIELRVAMGVLCTLNNPAVFGCVPGDAPAGAAPVTDGALVNDAMFGAAFPYLTTPLPGSPN